MSFGTMITILFTWYFQSLGMSLGVLPTALLAIPFAIIFMIGYMLSIDKVVFKYFLPENMKYGAKIQIFWHDFLFCSKNYFFFYFLSTGFEFRQRNNFLDFGAKIQKFDFFFFAFWVILEHCVKKQKVRKSPSNWDTGWPSKFGMNTNTHSKAH